MTPTYIVHKDGSGLRDLTNTPTRQETSPAFSPDGTRIVFSACTDPKTQSQRCGIYTMSTAGTSETEISTPKAPYLDTFTGDVLDPFWTPIADGTTSAWPRQTASWSSPCRRHRPGGPNNWVNIGAFMTCRFPVTSTSRSITNCCRGRSRRSILQFFNTVEFTGGSFLGGTHGMFVFNPGFGDPGVSTDFPGPTASVPTPRSAARCGWSEPRRRNQHDQRPTRKVGANWELCEQATPIRDEVAANLSVFTNTFPFPNTTVKVAYDNFRVNSGAITCPTWWVNNIPTGR